MDDRRTDDRCTDDRRTDDRPHVLLSDPGDIAAALPHLIGFHPEESVVVIGLGGGSGRDVGLTVRADIPPPVHAEPLAGALGRSIATDEPSAVLVAVVSEAPDEAGPDGGVDLPHRGLVQALVLTFWEQGVPVRDALLVREGRWWSYDCPHACCAPGAGTALPAGTTELAVASVQTGQVVAASREELAERLLSTDLEDRRAVSAACTGMIDARWTRAEEAGWDAVRDEAWAAITAAVAQRGPELPPAPLLPPEDLARILWGLRHTGIRDRALGLVLDAPAAAEALWTECVRRAPSQLSAAPATLLAVAMWLRGDGAAAGLALQNALDDEEDYPLAVLLRSALVACLRPADLRAMIAATTSRLDDACRAG